jgi:hypothetical protein
MAKTPQFGRASIFRNKEGGARVQGTLTPAGSIRFERARKTLARLAAREVEQVSDADVVEFLARGEADTIAYLDANK